VQTRRFVYFLVPVSSDDVISGQNQNIQLVCVESCVKINIWDVVSADKLKIMSSNEDESRYIYSRIKTAAGL